MASTPGVVGVERDEIFDIQVSVGVLRDLIRNIRLFSSKMYIKGNKFSCSSLDL